MTPSRWGDFGGIWSIDFEYATTCGTGRPIPHTFCALEVVSGRGVRLEGDDLRGRKRPPFDVRRCACLAYNFVAEAQCFEVLGWEQPRWPVDPYAEHLARMNGLTARDVFEPEEDERRIGFRILDAMRHYGIKVSIEGEAHKKAMQVRGGQGEPFTEEERRAMTLYCGGDVADLARLFLAMRDVIDISAALVRGRYMVCVGQQVHRGIPVDRPLVEWFEALRPALRLQLIEETPGASRFYTSGRFSESLFSDWTEGQEIGWPRTDRGRPDLQGDTFRRVATLEPRVAPLATLRAKLAKLEDVTFPVRSDDRIRPNYFPFRTRTGRNKPKASEYPMLDAKWIRGFVLAPAGRALAQLDFKAEEVYIAAALSGDRQLLADLGLKQA
jgi:hypothetical protein